MADGKRNDPYGQFNFLIEIDGVIQGGFTEASGLTTDTNVIEYREGNETHGTVRKLPGLIKRFFKPDPRYRGHDRRAPASAYEDPRGRCAGISGKAGRRNGKARR